MSRVEFNRNTVNSKLRLDLALVGTPRSGTSSLFQWLDDHPELQGSSPKETFYFMDASHPLSGSHGASYRDDGMEGYEQFFPRSVRTGALRLEATTHHYYQETARSVFSSLERPPLVLIVLREPGRRISSSFRYTKENLGAIDRSLSFNTYVDWLMADEVERARPFYSSESSYYIAARELELSRYVEWIDLWSRDLGRDRLEIVLLEDLRDRPKRACMRICERLGIDPSFYQTHRFPVFNRSFDRARSQSLQRLVRRLSISLPNRLKIHLRSIYRALQERSRQTDETNAARWGVQRLCTYFEPWNARLAQRYDLDLTPWKLERDGNRRET